jgi:glycosyltransferase involved in cell wall biosynthesis
MKFSQSQEPLVSICIPMFNAEKTIAKTIASIIGQIYKNIEIIIVDNCSLDASVRIIQEFVDPRIKIIQNDEHLPAAENNWNRCFQYVHGEFMAIFHADDVYLPDMIFRQIAMFKKNPTIGCVFTKGNIINENDDIIGELKLPQDMTGADPYTYSQLLNSILENGDFLLCPSAMMRSDLYKKLSPFRYDQFGSASDLDMWLRAAKCAPVTIINEKLMNYRISKSQGTQVLNSGRTHEADFFRVMDFHIAQNQKPDEISQKTMNKYNISRFGDQLLCIRNSFEKRDLKEFKNQIKNVHWIKYSKILINNPHLINLQFLKRVILK